MSDYEKEKRRLELFMQEILSDEENDPYSADSSDEYDPSSSEEDSSSDESLEPPKKKLMAKKNMVISSKGNTFYFFLNSYIFLICIFLCTSFRGQNRIFTCYSWNF